MAPARSVHSAETCDCPCNSSSNDDNRAPYRSSNESCQGVCGGVVFEKRVELDDDDNSLFFPLIDVNDSSAQQLVETRLFEVADRCYLQGGNFGRSVRTLHMSFLY